MERSFKGIWIPKEIWLSKELTLQEKVFLVEIDSLDNEDGCFASNAYFGDFFGLSNGRVSQVIKSLNEKGYITVTLEREGKQIIRRIIKINRPPYPIYNFKGYLENERGYLESDNTPIKFSKEGYLENDKENNTLFNKLNYNNKTNNNVETDIYTSQIKEVIDYLNEKSNKNFRHTTKKTQTLIKGLLKNKYTVKEIKKVIDIKVKQWGKDKKMKIYLRPETLFGNKFEGYLNEEPVKEHYDIKIDHSDLQNYNFDDIDF